MKSYVSEKIEIRDSIIHGKGMFAKQCIKKGEIVFIKGGHILSRKELFTSKKINSYLPIANDFFIAARSPEEEEEIKLFNNHSCDPNCGLRGEITFVAIRNIFPNEELTCDYAFIDDEDYSFQCNCGSPSCRKIVTGRDWKISQLQKKYYDYFAEYLKEKINMMV